MATKKTAPIQVTGPTKLVAAARSRARPTDAPIKGNGITQNPAYSILNNTVRNYKEATAIISLIRHLARADGPFATAVHNMVEIAATKLKIFAYDAGTHQFSTEATISAMALIANLDTPMDYTKGTNKRSFDAVKKTMIREAILTGAISAELVLSKAFIPERIQVVGVETLDWEEDGQGGYYPVQTISGSNDPVSLDIPTFFYDQLNPDPGMVIPRSMMEASIKLLVYFEEFMEDIQRSVRVAGHNRLSLTLDTQRIMDTAPPAVRKDPKQMNDYLESVKRAAEIILEGLEPDQALVMYDSAKAETMQSGTGSKIDYTPLLNVIVGQYATALKTPPSVLGLRLEGGTQQVGSVEAVMFAKMGKSVHTPVETVLGRMMTLGVRILGHDAYVWIRMDPIDLRPEHELEAFHVMRESRILDKLSLGLISDDEAAVEMDCFPRPDGAPDLSGTMFRHKNPVSTSPGDTPMGRDLQPDKDAPRKAGGRSQ